MLLFDVTCDETTKFGFGIGQKRDLLFKATRDVLRIYGRFWEFSPIWLNPLEINHEFTFHRYGISFFSRLN